ncbi:MAG: VWA domain-containing protein [Bacteroidota bacterium]|nr:VWA domain-containing protein [Bacteroidota bacterium]
MHIYDIIKLWFLLGVFPLIIIARYYFKWRKRAINSLGDVHMQRLRLIHRPHTGTPWVNAGIGALILLVIALCDVRVGGIKEKVAYPGLDVAFVLDVSKSMDCQDILPNRLERAKSLLANVLKTNLNINAGIIVFAQNPYVLCPMTDDLELVDQFAMSTATDMVSEQGTNVSEALDAGYQLLYPKKGNLNYASPNKKIIILLTDGENNQSDYFSEVNNKLRNKDIKVLAVACGTMQGAPIPTNKSEMEERFIKDKKGAVVISKPDINLLQNITSEAGGHSYIMSNDRSTLNQINNYMAGQKIISAAAVERTGEFPLFPIFILLACMLLTRNILMPIFKHQVIDRSKKILHR